MFNKRKNRAAAEAAAAARAEAEARQHRANAIAAQAAYLVAEGQKRAAGLVDEVGKVAGPLAHDAKRKSAGFAARRLDEWEPHIKDALGKVTPAVEAAREQVTESFLPRVQGLLHDVAEHPVVTEVSKRGEAAAQALSGDLEPKRRRPVMASAAKLLAIGAAIAGVVAAMRHFLAPKDDGWTAHEPSKAYVNSNDTFATAAKFADATSETPSPADASAAAAEPAATAGPAMDDVAADQPAPEAEVSASSDVTDGAPEGSEAGVTPSEGYGEGSYVGDNPPMGFAIKGNERSKKYHVEGSAGYERTIAEVWFNSEEAAEAAGFTRAQR